MRLLVIRTSAMGDVALTTPVFMGMSKLYPDVEIVMLTRPYFTPFFSGFENVKFFTPDFKKRHKGVPGIITLFFDIRRTGKIDHVIDLHDVLRSQILRFLFRMSGIPVSVIKKGRREKLSLVKGTKKKELKHSVERYCDAFRIAGFPVTPSKCPSIVPPSELITKATALLEGNQEYNIGIAPFAKHELKKWPGDYMIMLLKMIAENYNVKFWFFGGEEEKQELDTFQLHVPLSFNTANALPLDVELALISKLDLMIAMDSSNMHMAALTGSKVVSIWGGTDPLAGFGPWMQPAETAVRITANELECRPCTIFGKGTCRRGDMACMNRLKPETVFKQIELVLQKNKK